MAGTGGQTPDSLIDRIASNPFAFDFFQAVRRLQTCFADRPRIGCSLSPAQDPVRFAQSPSLAFPCSTLERLQTGTPSGVPRLFVNFFGLMGPNGPLPIHLTEYARERELHHGDRTMGAFLNLFHHRLLCFLFRAWAASQKAVDLDRPQEQSYPAYIGSLCGIGLESLQHRDAVPDWSKLYFAGRLACQTRNAEGLESILEEYFNIKTEVQTFQGRWLDLPADSRCKLGDSPETGSLGLTTIAGSHIWDCQLSFRLTLGPMALADYERMLPSGAAFQRLKYWVLNYCAEHFFWDAQLVLRAAEVPDIVLGTSGRLGWTTWLKTKPLTHDAADLIVRLPPE
ncbi:MAG TPA: type VI secretion system baseplate subunit TssG [Candidatus Binatia bacterium]|nr:type VI secretion system baseplate subunit TssG [Candidatus Binatia bacterium]